ncbi:hypothetical protein Tco_0193246, partial [Tanacetum coccineum]
SLNSAAGGNFLDKMPRECLKIIESKSKVRNSRSKPVVAKVSTSTSTSGISPDVSELKDMVKALLLDKKNQSQAPAHQPKGTLPGNTVTNPKEDLKGITTRSGVTIHGPKAVNHDTEVSLPEVVLSSKDRKHMQCLGRSRCKHQSYAVFRVEGSLSFQAYPNMHDARASVDRSITTPI